MKHKILYICIAICMFVSCTSEVTNAYFETERENIKTYLSAGELEYTKIGGVYRIAVKSAEGDDVIPEIPILVERGDSVYMSYSIYTFTSSRGEIVATNVQSVADLAGIEPIDSDPQKIEYGVTSMMNGFSIGLEGAMMGQEYELIVPFQYGYGDVQLGNVPPYTTLFIEFNISEIKK